MSQGKGRRANLEMLLRSAWEQSVRLENGGRALKPAPTRDLPRKFRWDYSLACVGIGVGVVLVLFPPGNQTRTAMWLTFLFAVSVYPSLHLARSVLGSRSRGIVLTTVLAPAFVVVLIGIKVWPPVQRHMLNAKECMKFEGPLLSQRTGRESIQLMCPQGDEVTCAYAGQFIDLFRRAGWRVAGNGVERVEMAKPMLGIFFFHHGEGQYRPDDWRAGLWFAMTDSVISVQQAFASIGIQPEGSSNPQLPDGTLAIYFGPPKKNEDEATELSRGVQMAQRHKVNAPY